MLTPQQIKESLIRIVKRAEQYDIPRAGEDAIGDDKMREFGMRIQTKKDIETLIELI